MISIYVSNVSAKCFNRIMHTNEHDSFLIFPEVSNGIPLTPAELVKESPYILTQGKPIFTLSEHLILFVCMCVRKTTNNEPTPIHLKPADVQVTYVDFQGYRVLRLDETGEFIDKWPNGFFREREPLLFD